MTHYSTSHAFVNYDVQFKYVIENDELWVSEGNCMILYGPRHTPNPLPFSLQTPPQKRPFLGGSVPSDIFSILEIRPWFKI